MNSEDDNMNKVRELLNGAIEDIEDARKHLEERHRPKCTDSVVNAQQKVQRVVLHLRGNKEP